MKQIIAFILIPLTIILILLKKTWELIELVATSIGDGIKEILTSNYEFWKNIFKWK